jgi:ubiquitin fusion degradation protein 1
LGEKSLVSVKNVSLSKATFVKFRAQSVEFLEVSNPRALLEVTLRKYTCLTVGDIICIPRGRKHFYLEVREVQPNGAASIIETDCNVDFEEPVGYKESKYAQYEKKTEEAPKYEPAVRTLQKARADDDESDAKSNKFTPFAGAAKRIDGKLAPSAQQAKAAAPEVKSEAKTTVPAESKSISNPPAPQIPTYETKIGDKFSKKKAAVAAFGGAARKLSG